MDIYGTFSSENLLSDFSKSAFVHHLRHLNSDSVHGNDVNKSFFVFYYKLDGVINKHASIKTILEHKVKQFNKAWISRAIRIAICKENELFYSGEKVKYNLQLIEIKSLLCPNSARNYIIISALNVNNIRHTWMNINPLTNNIGKQKVKMLFPLWDVLKMDNCLETVLNFLMYLIIIFHL